MSDVSKFNEIPGQVANNENSTEDQKSQSQANVRYIPITLDYEEKTVNTEQPHSPPERLATNSPNNVKPLNQRYQHSNEPTSIFNRVKHFPVNMRATQGKESPSRTIPIAVENKFTKTSTSSSQPASHDDIDNASTPSHEKLNADANAILKIQNIQKEIQGLMDQVDNFNGTRKDKSYMYIDEMLTQNLLKLDTIDTHGKDKIKQARREAIRCINKCISVLEAKAEAAMQVQNLTNDKSLAKPQN